MNTIFAMNEKLCCTLAYVTGRNGAAVMAYDGNGIIDQIKDEVTVKML